MNLFQPRRRDSLSELRLSQSPFLNDDIATDEPLPADAEAMDVPEEDDNLVSPANELATALVERDIAEAVRSENPPPAEPIEMPAPLSQRHLETIDRMIAHLKADEKRLEKQISDARRQLADTQLARHGYERNSAELRRGIAALLRLATTKPPAPRVPRASRAATIAGVARPAPANGSAEGAEIAVLKPRGRRRMH